MGCSECDIQERTEQYRNHLDRQSVYARAAYDVAGYWVDEDGTVMHGDVSEVNTDSVTYRCLAEVKERHDIDPKEFIMMVLEKARE